MSGRLQGKVAIITGASRGLGEYCAVGYAREGARVVIAARTEVESDPRLPGTIHHTAKLVEAAGGEALPVVCNVADMDSVEAMVAKALDHWGRVDILMTNAAVQPQGMISTIKIKSWELEFNINVHGPFRCVAGGASGDAGAEEWEHHQHLVGGGVRRLPLRRDEAGDRGDDHRAGARA